MIWIGLVCFVLGANFGFIVLGLLHAARDWDHTSEK